MEAYEAMSLIYDDLMKNVDYKDWAKFIDESIKTSVIKDLHHILELGCGSGNVTQELLELGYEVVGVDISEEMLDVAREKLEKYGDNLILINQDIRELDFEVYEIDVVTCSNDVFNYITEIEDLKRLLTYLNERMRKNGILTFDISSEYKLKNILGNNVFGESFDNMVYLWENFYDDKEKLVTMDINFFINEEGLYNRYSESHKQRAYDAELMKKLLSEAGFRNIKIYGDFSRIEGYKDNSERLFFVCEK